MKKFKEMTIQELKDELYAARELLEDKYISTFLEFLSQFGKDERKKMAAEGIGIAMKWVHPGEIARAQQMQSNMVSIPISGEDLNRVFRQQFGAPSEDTLSDDEQKAVDEVMEKIKKGSH